MDLSCSSCIAPAKYIEVDYYRTINPANILYCREYAFDEGRGICPYCTSKPLEFEDHEGVTHQLLAIYPQGELDKDGCCAFHP